MLKKSMRVLLVTVMLTFCMVCLHAMDGETCEYKRASQRRIFDREERVGLLSEKEKQKDEAQTQDQVFLFNNKGKVSLRIRLQNVFKEFVESRHGKSGLVAAQTRVCCAVYPDCRCKKGSR